MKSRKDVTENAGPENGGLKKDERTENAGLKMKDQMSGVENAGPNVMGGKCRTTLQGWKMQDQNTRTGKWRTNSRKLIMKFN